LAPEALSCRSASRFFARQFEDSTRMLQRALQEQIVPGGDF
jgi:hypothetical protein